MELTDNDLLNIELRANRYSFAAQADILDLLRQARDYRTQVETLEEEVTELQNEIDNAELYVGE